jgi:hypothetical protein
MDAQGLVAHPPVRLATLQNCHVLTVYNAGAVLNGRVLADVIRQCPQVRRLSVERRDNDWDAQETHFLFQHVDEVAQALLQMNQAQQQLLDFSLIGMLPYSNSPTRRIESLDPLITALCSIPTLTSVTLKAVPRSDYHNDNTTHNRNLLDTDTRNNNTDSLSTISALMSPLALQQLILHVPQRISLASMFPETTPYQSTLLEAAVTEQVTVQLYVHFGSDWGTTTTAQTKIPSPMCYFLKHVTLLNRQQQQLALTNTSSSGHGRRWYTKLRRPKQATTNKVLSTQGRVVNLLQYVAQSKPHFSMDAAYWLVRHHPWLCTHKRNTNDGSNSRGRSTASARRWKKFWHS